MGERFDNVFAGMGEAEAMETLLADTASLAQPVSKYIAATRLGASSSEESLDVLIKASALESDDLYDRIARRKAIDALGRRKNGRAIPVLIKALSCDDEIAVINAIDSITKIDTPLTDDQTQAIGLALTGPDNQQRAVIQAHTRLGLPDPNDAIRPLEEHDNPLVAGAACVYAARSEGRTEQLNRLIPQLTDPKAGRRHAAVIDLGDAGDVSWLEPLIRAPVSMPLRAKSAFKLLQTNGNGDIPEQYIPLLEQLLQDNPNNLDLKDEWIAAEDPAELEKNLQHRDEAKQYGAAKTLISLERSQAMVVIDDLQKKFGSDYVIHYYLTVAVSLGRIHERSDLIRASLAATIPQYAKSRVAAAWGCLNLQLSDQIPLLRELAEGSEWIPLKWSCKQVLHKISESG